MAEPTIAFTHVGPEPLVPAAIEAVVRDRAAGASVTFTGIVRDSDNGRTVIHLEYEAHPDATAMLASLVTEFCGEHPGLTAVAAAHRTGTLSVGEVAFVACVSSAHRREAFEACAALVDMVKECLPIWKRQVFTDGAEWVGA